MSQGWKQVICWMIMLCAGYWLWVVATQGQKSETTTYSYSLFVDKVKTGKVKSVGVEGNTVIGELRKTSENEPKKTFKTTVPANYPDVFRLLEENDVEIIVQNSERNSWMTLLINFSPFILLIVFWIFMMRQMQGGSSARAMGFGQSKARLLKKEQLKVTFKDVAGVKEAKEEVQEIVEFLREPQKFQKLGGRIPKGVLLVGAPGTGKTLLARAIAGEANVPFFSISGSDFVEMFIGVGASRVRDLFDQGKKAAPCIIFIDEIDAVGRHRGAGLGGGHDEREQTLNQLLVEMDGFDANEGVILIAATNRPDVLDPALLRPGRFDRRVVVPRPDIGGREEILGVHTKKVPLANDVKLSIIARGTPGFSGADLANLVNEAALHAARRNQLVVTMADIELSKDKVLMGTERRSLILTEKEKRTTACHEAGHALVAACIPGADPLHKVTIIPRGMALGLTAQLPLDDKHTYSETFLRGQLTILMGGRAAENIVFNQCTTGAQNDIDHATEIAQQMVCQWGMSGLGPRKLSFENNNPFLGKQIGRNAPNCSEATQREIDEAVKHLVIAAHEKAERIISEKRDALVRITDMLLEREVLDGAEIALLIEGQTLPSLQTTS